MNKTIGKLLSWVLKAVAFLLASAVGFLAMLIILSGRGADIVFGLVVLAGDFVATLGVFRSKSKIKMWCSVAGLIVVSVLLFGAVLPSMRRAPRYEASIGIENGQDSVE